ncbi:neutral zinc metallopeptidase [Enemella sp. A6]|uniref:neutral zinc metallopeptidase n=1 Tax=Enemella sp. A6 TaxID=3440152 RepID=UPI003EB6F7B8
MSHPGNWQQGGHQPNWQGGQWQQPRSGGGWPQHQQPGGWQQQGAWQQQGGWQQQGAWAQQGNWQQPAPARGPGGSGPLKKILGILLATCLLALVAFVVLLFAGGGVPGGYEYDDYEAPPATDTAPDDLMLPGSEDEAWQLLRENAAYQGTVPDNVNCELAPVEPGGMSDEQLQTAMNDFSACLMRVWDRPMTEQGVTMFRPTITVYSGPISTGCGTRDDVNAFYCGADQLIYYHSDLHKALPQVADTPLGVEVVMAHEFAHFLQGRTGIFGAFVALAGNLEESDRKEMIRRAEAQADCWSAQWVRANLQAMNIDQAGVEQLLQIYHDIGDDSLSGDPDIEGDHGLGKTRQAWGTTGLNSDSIGACNSWVVPAEQVR